MEDAKEKILAWEIEYDTDRPHSALGYRSPAEIKPVEQVEEATAA